MVEVRRAILVRARPQDVFAVVTDFAAYPQYFPEITSVTIEQANAREAEVTFDVQLIKTLRYTLQFELEPPTGLQWHLVSSDLMTRNTGAWEMQRKGRQTEVTYRVDLGLGSLVPQMVINLLVGSTLTQMMERVKAAAEARCR